MPTKSHVSQSKSELFSRAPKFVSVVGPVPLHRRKSFPFDLALQSRSSSVCLHPFNCRILGRGELGLLGVLVPFSSSDGATEITYTQELFHFSPNVPDRIGQSIIPLEVRLLMNKLRPQEQILVPCSIYNFFDLSRSPISNSAVF